jgi:hypothetical protein
VTTVRVEDFRPGHSVRNHWQPVQPGVLGQAQVGVVPPRPERRVQQVQPLLQRLQAAPPAGAQLPLPSRFWGGRVQQQQQQPQQVMPAQVQPRFIQQQEQPRVQQQWDRDRAVRDQGQARNQQERLQREADYNARVQQWDAARQRQQQDLVRQQQEAVQRQQAQPLRGREARVEQPQQPQQQQQPQQSQQQRVQPDGRGDGRQQRDDDERPGRMRGWGRG